MSQVCLFRAAGGKATVWIVGAVDSGVSTFAAGAPTSGNTLNAYDGETGQLLYQVGTSADARILMRLVRLLLSIGALRSELPCLFRWQSLTDMLCRRLNLACCAVSRVPCWTPRCPATTRPSRPRAASTWPPPARSPPLPSAPATAPLQVSAACPDCSPPCRQEYVRALTDSQPFSVFSTSSCAIPHASARFGSSHRYPAVCVGCRPLSCAGRPPDQKPVEHVESRMQVVRCVCSALQCRRRRPQQLLGQPRATAPPPGPLRRQLWRLHRRAGPSAVDSPQRRHWRHCWRCWRRWRRLCSLCCGKHISRDAGNAAAPPSPCTATPAAAGHRVPAAPANGEQFLQRLAACHCRRQA